MNIKNESGITLLALVVTIVVMIILASISISTSIGDNGLINQTQEAVIEASCREVEEALDAYILLKDKEAIKNGNFSGVNLTDLAGDTDDKILSLADTTTEPGYNIYTIKNISELNIKGDYGKGTTKDVFKVRENIETNEYEVFYKE